jgi:hypothetical protein
MALADGQVLRDRYRIDSLQRLGETEAVYRAWDTQRNVRVMLKEVIPQPDLDPDTLTELRQQVEQQAQPLASFDHPHLAHVTEFFEEGGNAYLVMDLVEGESLAERIEREGALPEEQVLQWEPTERHHPTRRPGSPGGFRSYQGKRNSGVCAARAVRHRGRTGRRAQRYLQFGGNPLSRAHRSGPANT